MALVNRRRTMKHSPRQPFRYSASVLLNLLLLPLLTITPLRASIELVGGGDATQQQHQQHHENENEVLNQNQNAEQLQQHGNEQQERQADDPSQTEHHEQQNQQEQQQQQQSQRPNWTFSERGVLVLEPSILKATPDKFNRLMQDHQPLFSFAQMSQHLDAPRPPLLLLLIHDPSCSSSSLVLRRLEKAAELMADFVNENPFYYTNPPLFGKINGRDVDPQWLTEYGITALPKLLFATTTTDRLEEVIAQGHASSSNSSLEMEDECLWLEYTGRQATASDIFQTALQYYMRLVLACGGIQIHETSSKLPFNDKSGASARLEEEDEDIFTTLRKGGGGSSSSTPSSSESSSSPSSPSVLYVLPPHFKTFSAVREFVREYRHGLLQYSVPVLDDEYPAGRKRQLQPGLPNDDYSHAEKSYIRWLLYDYQDHPASQKDRDDAATTDNSDRVDTADPVTEDFSVVIQCRHGSGYPDRSAALYKTFNQMARAMSNRRDRFYVTVNDCSGISSNNSENLHEKDGSVIVYKIPTDYDFVDGSWNNLPMMQSPSFHGISEQQEMSDGTLKNIKRNLVEFLVKSCSPTMLWFDRQVTAPIAFPLYRKVHAVLFVDLHHGGLSDYQTDPEQVTVRRLARQFHHACLNHWRTTDNYEKDMVCLVAPSTETRLLTTLGIDLWSPIDEHVVLRMQQQGLAGDYTSIDDNEHLKVLPTLLITDSRFRGTRRYYLEREDMINDHDQRHDMIRAFIDDFWTGNLDYDRKSDPRGPRTNQAGVRILTGNSLGELLTTIQRKREGSSGDSISDESDPSREQAQLKQVGGRAMVAFVAPSCGHCKRFLVLWNELAQLLTHIGWIEDVVQLYQIDVTKNDIIDLDVQVKWIPSLYYLSPDRSTFTEYNHTDGKLGDTVGAMNDCIEILSWFVHVAFASDTTDGEVRELLSSLKSFS